MLYYFYGPKEFCRRVISLEGMMLKLKLQYFGHLMWRVDSLEKTLMLGGLGASGEGDDRGWDGWMASLTQWTWVSGNSGSWWWTGRPGVLRFLGSQRVRHHWATDLIWSDLKNTILKKNFKYLATWGNIHSIKRKTGVNYNYSNLIKNYVALWKSNEKIHRMSNISFFYGEIFRGF